MLKEKVKVFKETLIPFWRALDEAPLNLEGGHALLKAVGEQSDFPDRLLARVQGQWAAPRSEVTGGRNLWGAYQAFTHVLSRLEDRKIERSRHLSRAIVPAFERALS